MYTGRVACCPLVSHAVRRIKVRRKRWDIQITDRRTDGRQTITLRLPVDAASIMMYTLYVKKMVHDIEYRISHK